LGTFQHLSSLARAPSYVYLSPSWDHSDHVKRFATKEAADAAAGHKTGHVDEEDEEMDEMSDAGSYSDGVDLDP